MDASVKESKGDETVTASEITPPKRRGRPPGSKNKPVDPEVGIVGVEPTTEKRKYTKRKITKEIDKSALAKQIQGVHQLIAVLTKMPELQLSENESLALADATANVAKEYGLELSGKTGCAIQLCATAAMIYVPRTFLIQARIKKESENVKHNGDPENT